MGSDRAAAYAAALAIVTGAVYIGLGLLQMGWVSNFLSRAVIAGFIASGLVGGFATDASLSKTSVADTAGQRTQLASLINAGLLLLTMLVLAGLFENLPSATLGAIVIDPMIG
jgi:MFS superfamily sulfate permease-like transporter